MGRTASMAWRRVRAAVLARDRCCVSCGAPAEEVDHIRPVVMGGGDELENLRALCRQCHSIVTAALNTARRRRISAETGLANGTH